MTLCPNAERGWDWGGQRWDGAGLVGWEGMRQMRVGYDYFILRGWDWGGEGVGWTRVG